MRESIVDRDVLPAFESGAHTCVRALGAGEFGRSDDGSRISREAHVRFWGWGCDSPGLLNPGALAEAGCTCCRPGRAVFAHIVLRAHRAEHACTRLSPRLIHSDRGSQYASLVHQSLLRRTSSFSA